MKSRFFWQGIALLACILMPSADWAQVVHSQETLNDSALADLMQARRTDWRNGAVVYQVMVDRFAPSTQLEKKRFLYPAPKKIVPWNSPALRGTYQDSLHIWSHEIDFWGGDLPSVTGKLDYLKGLGVDVVYLNPIFNAYTNHKYDTQDYFQISPEFGTLQDLHELGKKVHQFGMRLVLDGVFNHMGRNSKLFQVAERDPESPFRDWFFFGSQFPGGARGWYQASNLPELNLENPEVRDYLFNGSNSVVQHYLRQDIDGWRLDVAPELGPIYLAELTRAAHLAKTNSLIIGEVPNYPKEWIPSLDGVINFTFRDIILNVLNGQINAATATRMLDRTIDDSGIEPIIKSWIMLDNHDNPRLASLILDPGRRKLAQVLQFTLPGSPNLYYGSELGMTGGDDPQNRSPMRWDLVREDNQTLAFTKRLIALRREKQAIRFGNFRIVNSDRLLAFERYTDKARDTVIVVVNPSKKMVMERVMIANSKLMNGTALKDILNPHNAPVRVLASMITVSLPPYSAKILSPDMQWSGGYSAYKRVN